MVIMSRLIELKNINRLNLRFNIMHPREVLDREIEIQVEVEIKTRRNRNTMIQLIITERVKPISRFHPRLKLFSLVNRVLQCGPHKCKPTLIAAIGHLRMAKYLLTCPTEKSSFHLKVADDHRASQVVQFASTVRRKSSRIVRKRWGAVLEHQMTLDKNQDKDRGCLLLRYLLSKRRIKKRTLISALVLEVLAKRGINFLVQPTIQMILQKCAKYWHQSTKIDPSPVVESDRTAV